MLIILANLLKYFIKFKIRLNFLDKILHLVFIIKLRGNLMDCRMMWVPFLFLLEIQMKRFTCLQILLNNKFVKLQIFMIYRRKNKINLHVYMILN